MSSTSLKTGERLFDTATKQVHAGNCEVLPLSARIVPEVSVLIVNFNAGELLLECVRSVLAAPLPLEIIVADNGSIDGSIARLAQSFPKESRLRIVPNGKNLGFTRANNIALQYTSGRFVLLLNPDCRINADTLPRMLKALRAYPEAGMAGCLIRNPDGTEQAGCRRSIPTPWRTLMRVLHFDKLFTHPRCQTFVLKDTPLPDQPVFLEAISGAFMLLRREAIDNVGLLDEGYFLHCDDLDWCMRFNRAGWKVLFVPEVEIVHDQGGCSGKNPLLVLFHKHKGMVRFYRKFFRHQYPLPLMWLVVCAVWLRFTVLMLLELMGRIKKLIPDLQSFQQYLARMENVLFTARHSVTKK